MRGLCSTFGKEKEHGCADELSKSGHEVWLEARELGFAKVLADMGAVEAVVMFVAIVVTVSKARD